MSKRADEATDATARWFYDLSLALPRHATVVRKLSDGVRVDSRLRWLEIGCSLGSGRGDHLSDIDAAIGYRQELDLGEIVAIGSDLVASISPAVDVLGHRPGEAPPEAFRFAVEYDDGVQLDLVMFPAPWRTGLFDGTVAVVDKDGVLARSGRSILAGPPDVGTAREWAMLGWWAVSDIAKYLHRNSLFEALARVETARDYALRLHATAQSTPFPSFGLTSLLDYEPFTLPAGLDACYGVPHSRRSVERAAAAVAELLTNGQSLAGEQLHADIGSAWRTPVIARLTSASVTRE